MTKGSDLRKTIRLKTSRTVQQLGDELAIGAGEMSFFIQQATKSDHRLAAGDRVDLETQRLIIEGCGHTVGVESFSEVAKLAKPGDQVIVSDLPAEQ